MPRDVRTPDSPGDEQEGRSRLTQTLRNLIERVDLRLEAAPEAYGDDAELVRIAASQVLRLRPRLNLGRFVGDLGRPRSKPQFLLLFETEPGEHVVLKVYGKKRPGEAIVQKLWHRDGVPVVDVRGSGNDPVSWLMLQFVDGAPAAIPGRPGGEASVTGELAPIMQLAHDVGRRAVQEEGTDAHLLPSLDAGVGRHLDAALGALARHGYEVEPTWLARCRNAYGRGSASLLHGDLVTGNLIRAGETDELLLLDSCGYIGPAEFDAARWAARTGGAEAGLDLLSEWLAVETGLDDELASRLFGAELLMEAGVRELVKEENEADWVFPDPCTERLLEMATEMLPAA